MEDLRFNHTGTDCCHSKTIKVHFYWLDVKLCRNFVGKHAEGSTCETEQEAERDEMDIKELCCKM
jgi:hypothetical protein